MNPGAITATKLRLILAISLLLIEVLASLFIAYADQELKKYASSVSQITSDATASRDNIQTLLRIQQELIKNKDAVQRASEIVADSQSYQYQDQIITDLNNYANKASITITNIAFLPADPATAAATPVQPGSMAVPIGVKSTSVSVTIKNPVDYKNLLRFIKSIEQNLTKMQISRVGLAKDVSSSNVSSEVLTLEVYIR